MKAGVVQNSGLSPLQVVTAAQSLPPASPRIRSALVVKPDTVSVADSFTLSVTLQLPRESRIDWPALDSNAALSQRGAVQVRDEGVGGDLRRETAIYTLAPWDTGAVPIALPEVVIRIGDEALRVPFHTQVYVRSVLPGDTTQHVPKPARDLFPRQVPWWEQWWPVVAVLAALALLYWLHRRRRKPAHAGVAAAIDFHARAIAEFDRLDKLALADLGERGRYVALAVEILRTYLADRVTSATLSLTSSELVTAVRDDSRIPVTRLAPLLGESDAIKFARYPISVERARELAKEARDIVDEVERAEHERKDRIAAAEAEAKREESRAREIEDDAARRRSRRKGAA